MALVGTFAVHAQLLNPISWKYSATKIADNTYELRMTANIEPGWHLYSQVQPDDAIAEPTTFSFSKNPLLTIEGKIKEDGKMEKFHDAKLDVSANQYSKQVEFVQVVKIKGSAKTSVSGNVRYQTCNEEKCLPPKTVNFSIALK
jgi:thiol:disulfide interchange protein DsbD